ncbi:hypothetical protein DICVIV_05708 [Dictyocaulus viviparus]|uniref:Uncharacterized protein n=1 Tax=Dictyocaulus viviparus TaxID=29172 RepID=A0A0D8XUL7_DICVI|nr:hypothetical protein DICVIV_05708 [Dictyocaulus viviparus]
MGSNSKEQTPRNAFVWKTFEEKIEIKGRRIRLSLKDNMNILPYNKVVAILQLQATIIRLKHGQASYQQYQEIITQQMNERRIQKIRETTTEER